MVVVDSSVWIDHFNGVHNPVRATFRRLLDAGDVRIVVPDLVLFEVLRGFRHERDHRAARQLMEGIGIEASGGRELALAAAAHYRGLRDAGVTVRSALDVLIASFCIERGYTLLHRDQDFDAFAERRGLRVWQH